MQENFWGCLVLSSNTGNGLWVVVGVTYISSEQGCEKPESPQQLESTNCGVKFHFCFTGSTSVNQVPSLYQQVPTFNQTIKKYLPQGSVVLVSWRGSTLIWQKRLRRIGTKQGLCLLFLMKYCTWKVPMDYTKDEGSQVGWKMNTTCAVRSWARWLLPQYAALGPVSLVPHLRPQLVPLLKVALQWKVPGHDSGF